MNDEEEGAKDAARESGWEEMTKPTIRQPWLLYHGTTTLRLAQIMPGNALRVSETGDKKVALTPDRIKAELDT